MAFYRLFSVIDGVEWFWIENRHKNIQLQEVPQGSILGPTLFLLYSNDLPDDVICSIAIYSDDTILYYICDQASDLWQQLELASEPKSDLRDTVHWGRNWLVDFNAGKTQLVLFDRCNSTDAIEMKISGSVLEEKSSLKMIGAGARSCYLEMLYKNGYARPLVLPFAASLEPLAHRRNVTCLSFLYKYYLGRRSYELAQLVPLPYSRGRSTVYSDRLHNFSVTIPRCYKDVYVNSFFPCTGRLWNSQPIECFLFTFFM